VKEKEEMGNKIFLWNDKKSAGTGRSEDDFQPYIELSLLETAEPAGVVIVLPGGGYRARAAHEGVPVAEKFNSLGFHAVTLQYRVSPYRYPAPQQDVMRAVAMVRANAEKWHIDPQHIAVCGFSAGGHLAGCSGTIALNVDRSAGDFIDEVSARPDALILCYPVLSADKAITHLGSIRELSGKEEPDPEFCALVSLENQICEDTPPVFLWHTATDGAVNVQNSLRFARNMWAKGKTAELHVYPEGCHGLGLAADKTDVRSWPDLAANFLLKNGFPVKI
jgi:acetyl esterase/lipase